MQEVLGKVEDLNERMEAEKSGTQASISNLIKKIE